MRQLRGYFIVMLSVLVLTTVVDPFVRAALFRQSLEVSTQSSLDGLEASDDVVECLQVDIDDRIIEAGQHRVQVLCLVARATTSRMSLSDSSEGVGYLLKDRIGDVAEFLHAVRRVAAGGSAIDPQIVTTLLQRRRSDDPLDRLTPRERQVLELMATGTSNAGIAERLVITLRAAEKYVSSVFDKLNLASTGNESRRVLAVLLYLRR